GRCAVVSLSTGRLPLEVEADRHSLADLATGTQRLLRCVEPHAECLEPERPVLAGCLAEQLSPQAVGAYLERCPTRPGQRHIVVAYDDDAFDAGDADQVGPVPRNLLSLAELEPYEAREAVVPREVEMPRGP